MYVLECEFKRGMRMKRIGARMLCVLLCMILLSACGQTPPVSDESVPQDTSASTTESTTTTTTTPTNTTTTTTKNNSKVTTKTNAVAEQTCTEQEDGTTTSSKPITTHLVTPPATETDPPKSTTAKSAYQPPHMTQTTEDTTTTGTGTTTTGTGTTKDYTLPTVYNEANRNPDVEVWTDKEVYATTEMVTIYLRNLQSENLQVGNEFWLWEQVEGGWQTVKDKNGVKMALYVIPPQTPESDPLSIGMKLTDYDLKPNTRYLAGTLMPDGRWIGAQFMTADE